MKTNELGKNLIKKWEGLCLHAYQDIVGIWTVGYGSTYPKVTPNEIITEQDANSRFDNDLVKFEKSITNLVSIPLNSNQFSALVSLAFNVGPGNLKGKGLISKLNSGDYSGAANCFVNYDNAGGKENTGLYRRRLEEKVLFLTPIDSDPQNPLDQAIQSIKEIAITQQNYEQECLSTSPHWSDHD